MDNLDSVVTRLQTELPDAGYTRLGLAQLLVQFMQFMEEVAGKNVGPVWSHATQVPWPVLSLSCADSCHAMRMPQGMYKGQPKIPMHVFRDARPDGPLFALAARIHQIKKMRDMSSIEFGNPQRRREVGKVMAASCRNGSRMLA